MQINHLNIKDIVLLIICFDKDSVMYIRVMLMVFIQGKHSTRRLRSLETRNGNVRKKRLAKQNADSREIVCVIYFKIVCINNYVNTLFI